MVKPGIHHDRDKTVIPDELAVGVTPMLMKIRDGVIAIRNTGELLVIGCG